MSVEPYREDDLLSDFGIYLKDQGYYVLALSGNQQGRYWYNIGYSRKAPDIIAVRNNILLVGEAKVKSRELFRTGKGRVSDYQSLQYLLDTTSARQQLVCGILISLEHLHLVPENDIQIQAIVVGGDSFLNYKESLIDKRICAYHVDRNNGTSVFDVDSMMKIE